MDSNHASFHNASSIIMLQGLSSIFIWMYKGQRLNSPDRRTFDLLAEKQREAANIERRSKYKRLLPFHVDSIFSPGGRKFNPVKCSLFDTQACRKLWILPLLFVFIRTGTQTPSKRRRRVSQRKGQLRFDTDKITVCKRSAGLDGRTDGRAVLRQVCGRGGRGASRRRTATTPEWWWTLSILRADLVSWRDAPLSDKQATRLISECRNVGPFRDKRIISL